MPFLKRRRQRGRPVHQIINHLAANDAIGHDTLTIQARLRAQGHPSEIFALHTGPGLAGRARPLGRYPEIAGEKNVIIWHFSIGTEAASLVADLAEPVIMRYHNITPAHYFSGVNPITEMECRLGRDQLAEASAFVSLAIGDSAYNEAELKELGFRATARCPILLDLEAYQPQPATPRLARFCDGGPNILHVGRIVPQKRYEDLIKAFYLLQRIHPTARLLLAGQDAGMEIYRQALEDLTASLSLDRVFFLGQVAQQELLALYTLADAYLCLSEHEGFCVPLVEAMAVGLPVVAREAAAVAETLGPAGLLLSDPSPAQTAETLAALLADEGLRASAATAQQERLALFQPQAVWERFWGVIGPVVEA